MSKSKWCVIGTDPRMAKLAFELETNGELVLYVKSKAWGYQLERSISEFQADYIVFPIQPLELAVPNIDRDIFKHTPTCFVGRLTSDWAQVLNDMNCPVKKVSRKRRIYLVKCEVNCRRFHRCFLFA